ncbi:MAG: hypothetical protein EG824_01150 [Deltaproteobacteria bacterium]|nr:hypothetical protein [Deltaproteobacteria bacterium]
MIDVSNPASDAVRADVVHLINKVVTPLVERLQRLIEPAQSAGDIQVKLHPSWTSDLETECLSNIRGVLKRVRSKTGDARLDGHKVAACMLCGVLRVSPFEVMHDNQYRAAFYINEVLAFRTAMSVIIGYALKQESDPYIRTLMRNFSLSFPKGTEQSYVNQTYRLLAMIRLNEAACVGTETILQFANMLHLAERANILLAHLRAQRDHIDKAGQCDFFGKNFLPEDLESEALQPA